MAAEARYAEKILLSCSTWNMVAAEKWLLGALMARPLFRLADNAGVLYDDQRPFAVVDYMGVEYRCGFKLAYNAISFVKSRFNLLFLDGNMNY